MGNTKIPHWNALSALGLLPESEESIVWTNWGTVYLMKGKDVGFWSHEILSGERWRHPTLECVENAEWLALKIEDIAGKQCMRAQEATSKTPYSTSNA